MPWWGIFQASQVLSSSRTAPSLVLEQPVGEAGGTAKPALSLEREMRQIALGFVAANAEGRGLVRAGDLVPVYLPELTDATKRLDPVLDGETVRSQKAPSPEDCKAANGGKDASASEMGRAGLQCYQVGKATQLAFRSEAAKPKDLQWREVSARLRVVGGVPHLLLTAEKEVLPQCTPATDAMRGSAQLSRAEQQLVMHRFCLPAWRWEALTAQETGSVIDRGTVRLELPLAAGGQQSTLTATVHREGPGGRQVSWEFDLD